MKKIGNYLSVLAITALLAPVAVQAQKDTRLKEKGDRDMADSKGVEQIVITRKGDKDKKIIVEISGDKITINGKPAAEFKDGAVVVDRRKFKELNSLVRSPGSYSIRSDGQNFLTVDDKRAMLGVVTEKEEEGARISEVSKESPAEKAGLKEDDIITRIDDRKIEDPDDLTKAIREHKVGDKVVITYLRDKAESKATAELAKWKGISLSGFGSGDSFNFNMPDIAPMPRMESMPRMEHDQYNMVWDDYNGRPKLGISVQDTDDGKGVKVINVDDESNAEKAGIKEDDIITSINDKEVNSADEVAKLVRENKDKISIKITLNRDGNTQKTIDVKMPRKLKTANL